MSGIGLDQHPCLQNNADACSTTGGANGSRNPPHAVAHTSTISPCQIAAHSSRFTIQSDLVSCTSRSSRAGRSAMQLNPRACRATSTTPIPYPLPPQRLPHQSPLCCSDASMATVMVCSASGFRPRGRNNGRTWQGSGSAVDNRAERRSATASGLAGARRYAPHKVLVLVKLCQRLP